MRSILAFITVFMALCVPFAVYAAAFPVEESPGCDPEFLDALEAKTWMEGQREVEVASRLILKADSVLQYTCFNTQVAALAVAADSIFSDRIAGAPLFPGHAAFVVRTPPSPGVPGVPPFTPVVLGSNGPNPPGPPFTSAILDEVLTDLVIDPALLSYLNKNFGHTYAGGLGPAPAGLCISMNTVWNYLRCLDFDKSMFIKLEDMPTNDPRTLPKACLNAAARTAQWNANLARAYPPPLLPAMLGGLDLKAHYNNRINRGSGCASAFPILTGVTVHKSTGDYPDAVCSVPGCSYDGSGGCF